MLVLPTNKLSVNILDSILTNPVNPIKINLENFVKDFDPIWFNRQYLFGRPILRLVTYLLFNYNLDKLIEIYKLPNKQCITKLDSVPSDFMLSLFLQMETIPIELGLIEGLGNATIIETEFGFYSDILRYFYNLPQTSLGSVDIISSISTFVRDERFFELYPIEYLLIIRGFMLIPQIKELFTKIDNPDDIEELNLVSTYLTKEKTLDIFLMNKLSGDLV